MASKSANGLIDSLENLYSKAPALPKNAKDTIVNITPILAVVFGILGLLGSLGGVGLLTVFSPMALFGGAQGMSSYGSGFISAIFWLASSVLLLAAYPGTKARKAKGWNMLFWSELINLAGSVISLSLFSGIISAAIAFYLLFQIKPYYK